MVNNQNQLLENKQMREECISRVEVLEQVGGLLLLPNTEFATTEQVASYFGVGVEAIQSLIKDNREELLSNGGRVYKLKEIKEILNTDSNYLENGVKIPNRGMNLFP